METTTPSKKQIPTSVSAAADTTTPFSLSRFEDSPVFNYIKNLSPFEHIDSIRNDHTLNSLKLASPSLAFASPSTSSHAERRFLIGRHQFSDPLKPEFPCGRSENNTNQPVSGDAELPGDLCNEQLGYFTPSSEPPIEQLELAIELPTTSNSDSGSPDTGVMPYDASRTEAELEVAGSITPLTISDRDNTKERQHMLQNEKDLRKIRRLEQTDEAAGLDWVTLVSDVADLLNFNSWIIEDHSECQKTEDPGTISFISTVLDPPQDNNDDIVNLPSVSLADSCKNDGNRDRVAQLLETRDAKGEDEVPVTLCSTLTGLVVNDSSAKEDVKGTAVPHSTCERSMRRRCLVFEMAGAHKRKSLCDSDLLSSSTSSQSIHKVAETEKHLVSCKAGSSHQSSMLPGIGIHLNALASSSNSVKLVKSEVLAIGRLQEQREPRYANSIESMTSGQTVLIESSPPRLIERDVVSGGNEFNVMENAFQASLFVSKEIDHNSPKQKRIKLELVGESTACKRCNCKRSKCLKLYCECFAAGLYCAEPCSCQDCLNNPVHEKTVLETRSQIESRNPLAFAPKVIRSTDYVYENRDETNKTPASARHKRGCHCKKSSCLKKYCECFQGGVGCSISCRCQGCKNTFGCKDEAEETEFEVEETEVNDKNSSERNVHDGTLKQQKSDSSDLPASSEISRPTLAVSSSPLCNSQKFGRPDIVYVKPVFEKNLEVIPRVGAPKILKNNDAPICDVKSVSPKCKRISSSLFQPGSSTAWRRKKLILKSVPTFPPLGIEK